MKRTVLLFLLLGLAIAELFLLESFLPYGWHHPISEQLDRILPGPKYEPHPHMDREIETVLHQHRSLRIVLYLIIGAVAAGNAFVISKVWKACRRLKPSPPQT